MVFINMEVAFDLNGQVNISMTSNLVKHVVKETDTGMYRTFFLWIESDFHGYLRLFGVSYNDRAS